MATGPVERFSSENRYGSIAAGNGSDDLVAHCSEIDAQGFRSLEEGQKVEYEVGQGQKGLQAQKARPIWSQARVRGASVLSNSALAGIAKSGESAYRVMRLNRAATAPLQGRCARRGDTSPGRREYPLGQREGTGLSGPEAGSAGEADLGCEGPWWLAGRPGRGACPHRLR